MRIDPIRTVARLICAARPPEVVAPPTVPPISIQDCEREALTRLSIWQARERATESARLHLEGSPAFFDTPKPERGERAHVLAFWRDRARLRGATAMRGYSELQGRAY